MKNLYFEDVAIGQEITPLIKGPISPAHIMRWSAASENWHRIHYDARYAIEHDGLPDVMVNGSWKQHVLIQSLTDWVGEAGWLWKLAFQFRGMNVPGETLTAWGRVTKRTERGGYGVLDLDVGIKNEREVEGTPGTATVVLSLKTGSAVPYPFDPRILTDERAIFEAAL
jgi:acyl dehydratase